MRVGGGGGTGWSGWPVYWVIKETWSVGRDKDPSTVVPGAGNRTGSPPQLPGTGRD